MAIASGRAAVSDSSEMLREQAGTALEREAAVSDSGYNVLRLTQPPLQRVHAGFNTKAERQFIIVVYTYIMLGKSGWSDSTNSMRGRNFSRKFYFVARTCVA